jgi:hypothetical protein
LRFAFRDRLARLALKTPSAHAACWRRCGDDLAKCLRTGRLMRRDENRVDKALSAELERDTERGTPVFPPDKRESVCLEIAL